MTCLQILTGLSCFRAIASALFNENHSVSFLVHQLFPTNMSSSNKMIRNQCRKQELLIGDLKRFTSQAIVKAIVINVKENSKEFPKT